MINNFGRLADFEREDSNAESAETLENSSAVDMSAILNRLYELEIKVNKLLSRTTELSDSPDNGTAEDLSRTRENEEEGE